MKARQILFGFLLGGLVLGVVGLYYWLALTHSPEPLPAPSEFNFKYNVKEDDKRQATKFVCSDCGEGEFEDARLEVKDGFTFLLEREDDETQIQLDVVKNNFSEKRCEVYLPPDTTHLFTLEQTPEGWRMKSKVGAQDYLFVPK